MTIALVQCNFSTNVNSASARTCTVSPNSVNVATGNFIAVGVVTDNTGITVTVTDNLGNTYTQVGSYAVNGTTRASLFVAENVTGGACTVTVTPSATAYVNILPAEFSGVKTSSSADGNATNTGTSATRSTSSVSVAQAGDLVLGIFGSTSAVTTFVSTAGSVIVFNGPNTNDSALMMMAIADSAISLGMITNSSAIYAAIGASFKAASAGGGGYIPPQLNIGAEGVFIG